MFEHFYIFVKILSMIKSSQGLLTGPHNVGISGFTIVRETPQNLIHINTLATLQSK